MIRERKWCLRVKGVLWGYKIRCCCSLTHNFGYRGHTTNKAAAPRFHLIQHFRWAVVIDPNKTMFCVFHLFAPHHYDIFPVIICNSYLPRNLKIWSPTYSIHFLPSNSKAKRGSFIWAFVFHDCHDDKLMTVIKSNLTVASWWRW